MDKYNPYDFNNIEKCTVCGQPVGVDDYGNSDRCPKCGWKNSRANEEWDKTMGISYPMLVPLSRAREQYKNGLPFKATFEDFINGLFFYSEMIFSYKGYRYSVDLFSNIETTDSYEPYVIKLYRSIDGEVLQEFNSKEDFYNQANIDGRLLKDIWNEVQEPKYMYC